MKKFPVFISNACLFYYLSVPQHTIYTQPVKSWLPLHVLRLLSSHKVVKNLTLWQIATSTVCHGMVWKRSVLVSQHYQMELRFWDVLLWSELLGGLEIRYASEFPWVYVGFCQFPFLENARLGGGKVAVQCWEDFFYIKESLCPRPFLLSLAKVWYFTQTLLFGFPRPLSLNLSFDSWSCSLFPGLVLSWSLLLSPLFL